MALTGITWVGNIYQKFEAICLEVEEIMYQDTVEYVENQVQTVGASVKKFCSDVMQDFLPPSSMDPVKVASDLRFEQYTDVGIYKKPKIRIKEEPIKVDIEQLTEKSNVTAYVDKNVGHASSLSGLRNVKRLLPPSSGDSVKGACSDLCLGKKNGGIYKKSNVGIIEKPKKENQSPCEMLGVIAPVAKDLSRASSFCELPNKNPEAACDQIAMISHPVSDGFLGCDYKEEEIEERRVRCGIADATDCIADVSINLPLSDIIPLVASIENKEMKLKTTSSSGGLSTESNDLSSNNGVVSLIRGSAEGDTQQGESTDMEDSMSHTGRSDGWSTVVIERDDVTVPGMETIELIDKENLEETCVMVDGDELSVFHGEAKNKSYKSKIRRAFSSKRRSARKQEYEQLVARCGDTDTGSDQESGESLMLTLTEDSETKKSQSHDFCESEWELL